MGILRIVMTVSGLVFFASAASQDGLSIIAGSIVYIEYSVELVDGTIVTSNIGKDPMVYEAGGNKVLPALDKALRGRMAGEAGLVRLSPAEAFGIVDEDLFVEVPIHLLPEDARTVGSAIVAEDPQGMKQRVEVREVGDKVAVLDYNHPLAGKEIIYYVTILDVK